MIIHHIGLVVKNIEDHFRQHFNEALGYNDISEVYKDENLGVLVAFINMNDKMLLELIQPVNDKSPVYNFLQKRGQALHHLCFEVVDIEHECNQFRNKGFMLTMPPTPSVAFSGRMVAFFMSQNEDYLIELLQK